MLARDRAYARLRQLTVGIGVAATALVGVFAVLAASSNPGRSDAAAASTTSGDSSSQPAPGAVASPDQLQRPHHGSFGPASGPPAVVSGGSR